MNTDAIRAAKGQGLWGDTITSLCDTVEELTAALAGVSDDLAAANKIMAADADQIATLAVTVAKLETERDELAETVAVLSDSELMAAIAEAEAES